MSYHSCVKNIARIQSKLIAAVHFKVVGWRYVVQEINRPYCPVKIDNKNMNFGDMKIIAILYNYNHHNKGSHVSCFVVVVVVVFWLFISTESAPE